MIQAVQKFERLTKYPLTSYFEEAEKFLNSGYPAVVKYFQGAVNQIKLDYVKKLFDLKKEAERVSLLFDTYSDYFDNYEYWELLDFVESLRKNFLVISKIDKFLRSSRNTFDYKNAFDFDYNKGQNESLEDISREILKDSDFENSWIQIALRNDLFEYDYSSNSGKNLILSKEIFVIDFVTSVVDNMIGERIYGLDLQKLLEFENDDLKVLSHRDTVFQCVEILASLKKGDIPQFPNLGIPRNLLSGGNIGGITYSRVVEEMNRNFLSDDLFVDFQVTSIRYSDGDFFIEYKVNTKYQLFVEKTAVL
jgi:hypothetical protein